MKLVSYLCRGRVSAGKIVDDVIVDFPASDATLPGNLRCLLEGGEGLMDKARHLDAKRAATVPLKGVTLLAPIPRPSKFLAIGTNYKKHAAEAEAAGFKVPNAQVWFNKQVSCINTPFGDVHMPVVSDRLDYEVELCVVIGKRCRHVSVSDARSVIAGYMVANDFTVRDWTSRSPTMTIGKSFDTHGPVGPWITTDDEVSDPHDLMLRLFVNGELRQEESSGGMTNDIYQQIAELTAAMTLEPGDLLSTGTPSGVGIAMKPPRLLKVGDIVRAEVQSLGYIENRIVAEPA